IGAGAVAASRLRRALGLAGDGIDAIAAVLGVHPAFLPDYARAGVLLAGDRARLWLADGAAFDEGDPYSWYALLDDAPSPSLDAIVQAVNPRARCVPVQPHGEERLAWEVIIDPAAQPVEPPMEVSIVASTTTAAFTFPTV
ncbi:MAG: hypothetical protein ACRERC_23045, partial [Candidatus Binatia bacterium]